MPRVLTLVVLAFLSGLSPLAAQAPGQDGPDALVNGLEAAWKARDAESYLSLWEFASLEAEAEERRFVGSHFRAEETHLSVRRSAASGEKARMSARVFTISEPRSRVEQWLYLMERRSGRWKLVGRERQGQIEGLVHLSLDPGGFRGDGLSLRLEDFELKMVRGTLFKSPPSLGPTALVFVGEGTVSIRPAPPPEREQLRQFCGKPEMVERVQAAFIRIHPADLRRVLSPERFDPDPEAGKRQEAAQKFYREHASRAFILDAALPRSPWWVLPSLGDASITFRTRRLGSLTFTVNSSDAESISLFDRARRRQICLYPSAGREARYNEDEGRALDVLDHDLRLRFEPDRTLIAGEDTLRVQLLQPAATIRLKLAESLRVESISSTQGGQHLVFRVRGQDSLLISLGALSGTLGEISLTVRYSGILRPGPIDREVIAATQEPSSPSLDVADSQIENVLIYTNRSPWYPQAHADDYATATLSFDVPLGFTALTGGESRSVRVEGNRTLLEYRQGKPGKYITVAVGRLQEMGQARVGSFSLHAFGIARSRRRAQEALARAGNILSFYEEEFGPSPYPDLNLVFIEGFTPGGHSPPGMIVVQDRPVLLRTRLRDDPANFSDVPDFFLAHELAHQWWGQGVAGQNYRERWLSEGAAQYAAALWAQRAHGEEVFQGILRRMARWALDETEEGPIHLGHRLGHIKGNPQVFRAVVYDKGAYVFFMLRHILGEQPFRQALRSFQAGHRFAKAGTDDFRQALEAASGSDLSAYFREWVFGTELPALVLSHRSQSRGPGYRTAVEVKVTGLPGPVPLTLSVHYDGGVSEQTVMLPPEGGAWTVDTPGKPGKVEVNDDRALLATVKRG